MHIPVSPQFGEPGPGDGSRGQACPAAHARRQRILASMALTQSHRRARLPIARVAAAVAVPLAAATLLPGAGWAAAAKGAWLTWASARARGPVADAGIEAGPAPVGAARDRAPLGAEPALLGWAPATFGLPGAAANPETDIEQVTCPGASVCVAVGGYALASGSTSGFIAWGVGRHWSAVPAPVPPGARVPTGTTLSAVACASLDRCAAVGGYVSSAGRSESYLLSGSRGHWVAAAAPSPGGSTGGQEQLVSLACAPRGGRCVAVGSLDATSAPVVVTGYGSSWAATALPVAPVLAGAELSEVSCPSPTGCVALGSYTTAGANAYGLVAHWDGRSWAVERLPRPDVPAVPPKATLVVGFTALSCASVVSCTAMAYYQTASGPRFAGALSYESSAGYWRPTVVPLPAGASEAASPSVDVPALACARLCVAVVSYMGNYGQLHDLPVTYLLQEVARGRWRAEPPLAVPAYSGAQGPLDLSDVACGSTGACVAAGTFSGPGLLTGSALVAGNLGTPSGAWRVVVARAPLRSRSGGTYVELSRVACSARQCVALGDAARAAGGPEQPLVETALVG